MLFTHGHADHVLRSRRHAAVQRHSGQPHPMLSGDAADDRRDPQDIFVHLRSEDGRPGAACPRSISTWCDAPFEIGGCRIVPVPLWHGKRRPVRLPDRIARPTSPTSAGSPTSRGPSSTASTCSCSTRCATVRIPRTSASSGSAQADGPHPPGATHGSPTSATTSVTRRPHASLPPHVQLAYDGLSVDFSVD